MVKNLDERSDWVVEICLQLTNTSILSAVIFFDKSRNIQVPRYDAVRLAQSLLKKGTVRTGSSSQFNWRGLGFQVGVCFNSLPPNVSFLYGPLDAEYAPKERKKVERRKKAQEEESANEEEEEPEDVDQTGKKKSDGNELSAVQKHISVISKTLTHWSHEGKEAAVERWKDKEARLSQEITDERVIEKKQKKFLAENSHVGAVECLFNPRSFTQTVEVSGREWGAAFLSLFLLIKASTLNSCFSRDRFFFLRTFFTSASWSRSRRRPSRRGPPKRRRNTEDCRDQWSGPKGTRLTWPRRGKRLLA